MSQRTARNHQRTESGPNSETRLLLHTPQPWARVVVVGVGGGGCASVERMADAGLKGVELLVVDTDAASLAASRVHRRLRIGSRLTHGLGAGGDAGRGAQAASEAHDELCAALGSADLVLVIAGLGGGTGSGAAPVIAGIAREVGALPVAVVTWPFTLERARRWALASAGMQAMGETAGTHVVIACDCLVRMKDPRSSLQSFFSLADDMVCSAVRCLTDLFVEPGFMCFDFTDPDTILAKGGSARLALGQGEGERRARRAAEMALACPLLDAPVSRAAGILLNVTGGPDMTLAETAEAIEVVHHAAGPDVPLLYGAVMDRAMAGTIRVTAILTGMDAAPPPHRQLESAFATEGSAWTRLQPAPRSKR